jgi:flagellar biosynthetic protein FliQ
LFLERCHTAQESTMTPTDAVTIGRELMLTTILVALPALVISLVVGLGISIFQALTSIQEQTLSFTPRIIAVATGLVVTMPWTLKVVMGFTCRMFRHVAEGGL